MYKFFKMFTKPVYQVHCETGVFGELLIIKGGTQSHSRITENIIKMFSDDHSTPVLRNKGLQSVSASFTSFICIHKVPASCV